jgi:hypothetical protein
VPAPAALYPALKLAAARNLRGDAVANLLLAAVHDGWTRLHDECEPIELGSNIAGKSYLAFRNAEQISRPINRGLFNSEPAAMALIEQFVRAPTTLGAADGTRAAYTAALSVLASNDILGIGRKASATFFEILIGHMVAVAIGVNPSTKVSMPEDAETVLPTDYIFTIGAGRPKIHLPIKTSTRERAVQAWVHQLVLERIFGANVYKGILVVIGETKRDTRTNRVIEICIPGQLRLFQSRLVQLERVYYLDPPAPYLALATAIPTPVNVRPFGDFFNEVAGLTIF